MAAAGTGEKPPKSLADGRFLAEERVGHGAFAQLWRGRDKQTGENVAIKFEDYRDQELMLEDEAELLRELARPQQKEGFARCLHYCDEGPWQCLVMELLGPSLADHLQARGGRLSLPNVLVVAEQALRRLEYLHSKGYVHRDVKPENFLAGLGPRAHVLHLIDFGLSRRYWTKSGHDLLATKRAGLAGTTRYASINALKKVPQTRRDDLESLGYVLVYLLKGSLPWSGLPNPTPEGVLKRKKAVGVAELCSGLPEAFSEYLECVRAYRYSERPDYGGLLDLFLDLQGEHCPGGAFDWLPPAAAAAPRARRGEREVQPDDLQPSRACGGLEDLKARFFAVLDGSCGAASGSSEDESSEEG